jgi:hypothetical protein
MEFGEKNTFGLLLKRKLNRNGSLLAEFHAAGGMNTAFLPG